MDNRRTRTPVISTGAASIVLIFVMLSLLTFAVLSLVSAQADLRLSQKSAGRTTDYYAAENQAGDVLLGLLRAQAEDAGSLADYAAQAGVSLAGDRAAYEVPLGEDQALAVEVLLPADGQDLQIIRWQAVSRYDWAPDDSLQLLGTDGLPADLHTED